MIFSSNQCPLGRLGLNLIFIELFEKFFHRLRFTFSRSNHLVGFFNRLHGDPVGDF